MTRASVTDTLLNIKVSYSFHYVRHAGNYLIAVNGPKWLAKDIQKKTQNFLKSNLYFSLKGGDLAHGSCNSVRFLGFDIKIFGTKKEKCGENP